MVEVPDQESQYRLLTCGNCGCTEAGYQEDVSKARLYRVKCPGCGQITPWFSCKHDAQIDWNGRFGVNGFGWNTV